MAWSWPGSRGAAEGAIDDVPVDVRRRLVVAGSAARLVRGLEIAAFDHVTHVQILLHNDVTDAGSSRYSTVPLVGRGERGELHWPSVEDGVARADGMHVVVHELAHAFDHSLGCGLLQTPADRAAWEPALHHLPLHTDVTETHAITSHVDDVAGPELFAVASELFFEVPRRLRELAPSLLDELRAIYNLDPRDVTAQAPASSRSARPAR